VSSSGEWVWTASGREINLKQPNPNNLTIDDIATHLSRINRFNGATWRPYSVAQHSVAVSDYLVASGVEAQRAGLLHDAHEAYIGDITRPIADYLESGRLDRLKRIFDFCIGLKFGIDLEKVNTKDADNAVLDFEIRYRVKRDLDGLGSVPRIIIADYSPDEARDLFLSRFYELWPDLWPAGRVA
jgi:uncharacterized protein